MDLWLHNALKGKNSYIYIWQKLVTCKTYGHSVKKFKSLIVSQNHSTQGDGHLGFCWDSFGHILIIIFSLSVFKSQSSICPKVTRA